MDKIEKFFYCDEDFSYSDEGYSTGNRFDKLVFEKWDAAMKNGHMRYSLDNVLSREIEGKYKYFVQLNTKRGTERRKPEHIDSLQQPFDESKFNFSKIKAGEIICRLCHKGANVNGHGQHLVLVNVSPLAYGHILLVPNVNDKIPQKLTFDGVLLSVHLLLLSSPNQGMRIGFNSLCALASVNHQHVHAWYLEKNLYTEDAPVKNLYNNILFETEDLPIPAFVCQLENLSVTNFARCVYEICNYLQENEIAHNVFFTRGAVCGLEDKKDQAQKNVKPFSNIRVYIFPRKKQTGAKNAVLPNFNIAVCELAGQIPVYVEEAYPTITEAEIIKKVKDVALPDKTLDVIRTSVVEIISKLEKSFNS